jgi:hypothetical protein
MLHFALLFILLSTAHTAKVVDLFGNFNNFACLKSLGYEHSIVRAYHSYGAIDLQAPQLIKGSN